MDRDRLALAGSCIRERVTFVVSILLLLAVPSRASPLANYLSWVDEQLDGRSWIVERSIVLGLEPDATSGFLAAPEQRFEQLFSESKDEVGREYFWFATMGDNFVWFVCTPDSTAANPRPQRTSVFCIGRTGAWSVSSESQLMMVEEPHDWNQAIRATPVFVSTAGFRDLFRLPGPDAVLDTARSEDGRTYFAPRRDGAGDLQEFTVSWDDRFRPSEITYSFGEYRDTGIIIHGGSDLASRAVYVLQVVSGGARVNLYRYRFSSHGPIPAAFREDPSTFWRAFVGPQVKTLRYSIAADRFLAETDGVSQEVVQHMDLAELDAFGGDLWRGAWRWLVGGALALVLLVGSLVVFRMRVTKRQT